MNGHLSRAEEDMKARSAKPRIVQPMPRPTPLTATTSGLGKASRASTRPGKPCRPRGNVGSVAIWCISSRSVPAEKPRPLPVSSTTATSSSVAASCSASASASYNASLKALSASGRSRVSVRTRCWSATRSVMAAT